MRSRSARPVARAGPGLRADALVPAGSSALGTGASPALQAEPAEGRSSRPRAPGASPQPALGASWPRASSAALPSPAPHLAQPLPASLALLAWPWGCAGGCLCCVAPSCPLGSAKRGALRPAGEWGLPTPCPPAPQGHLTGCPACRCPGPFPGDLAGPRLAPPRAGGISGPWRLPGRGAAQAAGPSAPALPQTGPGCSVPGSQQAPSSIGAHGSTRRRGLPGRRDSWQLPPKHLRTACLAAESGTGNPVSRFHPASRSMSAVPSRGFPAGLSSTWTRLTWPHFCHSFPRRRAGSSAAAPGRE